MAWDFRTLTEAVNIIVPEKQLYTNLFFKNRITVDSAHVDADVITSTQTLATPRSDGAPARIAEKRGRASVSVRLPVFREKVSAAALELLTQRIEGGSIYLGGKSPADYINAKLGDELKTLKDRITRTIEYMAAQAMRGNIAMTGEEVDINLDFGIASGNKPSKAGNDKWGGTSAKIKKDLRAWQRLCVQGSGYQPDVCILGSDAADAFVEDASILKVLDQNNVKVGALDLTQGISYIGRFLGMDIYEDCRQYTDASGVSQNFTPASTCLLASTQADQRLFFGPIIDLDANGSVMQEFFSKSWTEKDPSVTWLLVESHPLPVPYNPNSIVVATVV
jgi:hypothetical protein